MVRKSCRSHGERIVTELLLKYKLNFISEYSFKNCLSSSNTLLRFDFYLPEQNILIEYQGQHHYQPINKYSKAKKTYRKMVLNDVIKRQFCEKNNIKLITIPYWDQSNIEQILLTNLNLV